MPTGGKNGDIKTVKTSIETGEQGDEPKENNLSLVLEEVEKIVPMQWQLHENYGSNAGKNQTRWGFEDVKPAGGLTVRGGWKGDDPRGDRS